MTGGQWTALALVALWVLLLALYARWSGRAHDTSGQPELRITITAVDRASAVFQRIGEQAQHASARAGATPTLTRHAAGWRCHTDPADPMHIWPAADLIEHHVDDIVDCPCAPRRLPTQRHDGSMAWLVVHNAQDGRE